MWRNWCVGEGSGGREGGENVCMGEKCVCGRKMCVEKGEKCVWRGRKMYAVGVKNNFFLLFLSGFIKADYFIDVGLK